MSDTTQSGDTTPVAPAETASAPAQTATPAFGTSRGSGLARGKRSSNTATNPASAPAADYKPTAIQVVSTAREYKNPFAPVEAPAESPAATQQNQENIPAPAASAVPSTTAAPAASVAEAGDHASAPVATEPVAPAQAAQEEPPARTELKILPPAEKQHRSESWESTDAPASAQDQQSRQGNRSVFQPRRQNQQGDRRNRDSRRDRSNPPQPQPAADRPAHTPASAPQEKKSSGFIGWLKGVFGGSDEPETTAATGDKKPETGDRSDRNNREGRRHRHHHGGRDNFRGGDGRPEGQQHGQERRFDRGDRGDRSRQRGGGRGRGSRRFDRGSNRSEGQSGGGSI